MKRIFDVLFSALILIFFSPLLLLISLLLFLSKQPIIYKHLRMGKDHRTFYIYKFCTMTNQKDKRGKLLPDEMRTTLIGNFLRSSSLDEIPGFINVLFGDMSVVGPRPLPPIYKHRYSLDQDKRHNIKPGVTGWAQVNGRNAISWEEKFELDIWYVENQSLYLDLKIILLTIYNVLKRKNIVPKNKNSMDEFMGTDFNE